MLKAISGTQQRNMSNMTSIILFLFYSNVIGCGYTQCYWYCAYYGYRILGTSITLSVFCVVTSLCLFPTVCTFPITKTCYIKSRLSAYSSLLTIRMCTRSICIYVLSPNIHVIPIGCRTRSPLMHILRKKIKIFPWIPMIANTLIT